MTDKKDFEIVDTLEKNEGQQLGKYLLTKPIGEGQFGKVWLAINIETKKKYACKQINRQKIDQSKKLTSLLATEIHVMKTINHPNILRLHDQLLSKNNYYLVVDYCDQGDMISYMKSKDITMFEEIEAVNLLRQLMNGFVELRRHRILHRDLKLANLLMNSETLVIGDFGIAKNEDMGETMIGTPFAMAPELYFKDMVGIKYNSKADLWSIGVIVYQLLFNDYPFQAFRIQEMEKIITNKLSKEPLRFKRQISDETSDFLRRIFVIDPKQRMSWEEAFIHPIFKRFPALSKNKALLFEKNKSIAGSEVDFLSENQEFELDSFISLQHDSILSIKDKKIIYNLSIIREVRYCYHHQLNIICFHIHAAKAIIKSIKSRKFHFLDQSLMNLSVLIIVKGIILSKALRKNLSTNINCLNLEQNAFLIFNESTERVEIIATLTGLNSSLKKHYDLNLRRIKKNKLKDLYSGEIDNGQFDHLTLDQIIEEQGNIILSYRNRGIEENYLHDYFYMCANIVTVIKSFKFFVYMDSKRKDNSKFNWPSFYNLLERGKTENLKRMGMIET